MNTSPKLVSASLLLALSTGCAQVCKDQAPIAGTGIVYNSQNWLRGAPLHMNGVLVGSMAIGQETTGGDTMTLSTVAIADTSGDPGNGLATPRNGSDIVEIDVIGRYTRDFGGAKGTLGLANYNFPSGGGANSSTTEVFGTLTTSYLDFSQSITLYYDVDALDDYYLSIAGSKSFTLAEDLNLSVSAQLGHIGEDQAAALFGVQDSGLSDVVVSARLNYAHDALTTFFGSLSGVSNLGSDFKDALDSGGFETSGVWLSVGARFSL